MKHPVYLLESQMVTLEKGLRELMMEIHPEALTAFRRYIDLILGWNRRISLISTTDESRIVEKHILPSLAIYPHIPDEPINWLDVGSGAGFPAIPLKIIRRDPELLMVESRRKKAIFLMKVIRELNLRGSEVVWSRLEELPADRKYDLITARAVENPHLVLREASRRLQPSGLIFYLRDRRGVEDFRRNMPHGLSVDSIVKLPGFTRTPRLYLIKLRLCDEEGEIDKDRRKGEPEPL